MTEQESLELAIYEKVALVPYDPRWTSLFVDERDRLLSLFPKQWLGIEHIGSTAIPGMPAKPIIDIMAGVESMAVADALGPALLESHYTTSAEYNASLADRRWFMRYANGHRTHHLHVMLHGGRDWHRRLRFRDALRADTQLAQRYAELKHELTLMYTSDREAYTRAKTDFVLAVLGPA